VLTGHLTKIAHTLSYEVVRGAIPHRLFCRGRKTLIEKRWETERWWASRQRGRRCLTGTRDKEKQTLNKLQYACGLPTTPSNTEQYRVKKNKTRRKPRQPGQFLPRQCGQALDDPNAWRLRGERLLPGVEFPASFTQHATRNTQHATRITQHATRNTQHASRNTHHATRITSCRSARHPA
jgi:hypothetical protein